MIALKVFFALVALLLLLCLIEAQIGVQWRHNKGMKRLVGWASNAILWAMFAAAIGVVLTGCALNKTLPQVSLSDWLVYGSMAAVLVVAFWVGDGVVTIAVAVVLAVAIAGCGDTINPVRYQTVEVLVTKPCLAGRTPPAQAVLLTDPVCTLPPAECVRAAAADIAELQREARESRNLIRECSK